MTAAAGLDIGTTAAKAVLLLPGPPPLLPPGWCVAGDFGPRLPGTVLLSPSLPPKGAPLQAAQTLLHQLRQALPAGADLAVCCTGSAGRGVARRLALPYLADFQALLAAVARVEPEADGIVDLGGSRSSFLKLAPGDGGPRLADYGSNGACAAGSGSFLDQQAVRLGLDIGTLATLAAAAERTVTIAGRCSVFARSDMIHAQQKGAATGQILRGLCAALARSYCAGVLGNRTLGRRTLITGGVAGNRAVVAALRAETGTTEATLAVAPHAVHLPALGAALAAGADPAPPACREDGAAEDAGADRRRPLPLERVRLLAPEATAIPDHGELRGYLGIDIGSVSTNLVLLDTNGRMLWELYLRTAGDPLRALADALGQLQERFPGRVRVLGAGTTGSGRELAGELIGADVVHDEITAHTTGAGWVAGRCLGERVDTILEIGGQDAKFISIADGVVVDFAMNEACSAGTGSFLEEQAERLGVEIRGEFSRLACAARRPTPLGERCTVFMEQDVTAALERGESREELCAGVASAVAANYLTRVKGDRPVGRVVFFQGGTAYNHAVAAAFAGQLDTTVIVPPHNGVMGAYGAALLARQKLAGGGDTRFRGFSFAPDACRRREFTCTACSNSCVVQEFRHDEGSSYWGDKCAVRFRRPAAVARPPVIDDLFAQRDRELHRDYGAEFLAGVHGGQNLRDALRARDEAAAGRGRRVTLLRTLYHFDVFPFWHSYLTALGHTVQLTPATTAALAAAGVAHTVAEPCFPIQTAHGHARAAADGDADLILLPALIDGESAEPSLPSHFCPWGQTLPYVLAASPALAGAGARLLTPVVHFRRGEEQVERELWACFAPHARSRRHHRLAVALGFRALALFRRTMGQAGAAALATLERTGAHGVVALGRGYSLHDQGLNLFLPDKLRQRFGVNLIPLDCLPLTGIDITDLNDNMYWHSGRRMLQGARFLADRPGLHGLWLTHFGCGPDSYVKPLARDAAGKPLLVLQLDGHGNDAGMLTRCEAYLHSLGLLS